MILIAAFFSLLSRFSFALLMHPAYAVEKKNLLMLLLNYSTKSSSAMGDYWFDHAIYGVGEARYTHILTVVSSHYTLTLSSESLPTTA